MTALLISFTEIAPPVEYGSIGCLKSSAPVMTSIPKEVVNRMPGETTAEKCAWAARKQRNNLFAMKSGAECTASKVSATQILAKLESTCSGSKGERELFFVGGMCGTMRECTGKP